MRFEFDGSVIEIAGHDVTVSEGSVRMTLTTEYGGDLAANGRWNADGLVRVTPWVADRVAYCFALAARRIMKASMVNK